MRTNIGGYEIEVKAKGYGSTRFNKQDTMSFLCHLCVELIYSKEYYESNNLDGSRDATQRDIDTIRALLDENHYDPTK